MSGRRKATRRKETLFSVACAMGVFLLLVAILVVRNDAPEPDNPAVLEPYFESSSRQQWDLESRFLEEIMADGPDDITDDFTRDETCKEFMSKFLNGTTDDRDIVRKTFAGPVQVRKRLPAHQSSDPPLLPL